jgi:hypothetical protein
VDISYADMISRLIATEASVRPRDVPNILLAFLDNHIVDKKEFAQSLRKIVATKVVQYAFPFASWLMEDIYLHENDCDEIYESERDYIESEYPEIRKIWNRGWEDSEDSD